MSLRLLALDSATETLHLALVCGESVRVRRCAGGALASTLVLESAATLLAEAGCSLGQIDAFAFGRGPGAFTGLRTACAVVQGWALGCARPVLPIDTLMAVAESARRQGAGARVWALHDARMGEVYAACYEHDGQAWQVREAPALWPAAEAFERARAGLGDLAGNALVAHGDQSAAWHGRAAWPAAQPDGEALAVLARAAHARGEAVDAALALPLYVRDKVALTTAERAAARRDAAAAAAATAATQMAADAAAGAAGAR